MDMHGLVVGLPFSMCVLLWVRRHTRDGMNGYARFIGGLPFSICVLLWVRRHAWDGMNGYAWFCVGFTL